MDDQTKQALEAMEARIAQRFAQLEERLLERIFDTESKLLNAFRGWSVTTDARTKVLPSIQERMTSMEDRITAVERKLLERGN
jgi:hypothetical protein